MIPDNEDKKSSQTTTTMDGKSMSNGHTNLMTSPKMNSNERRSPSPGDENRNGNHCLDKKALRENAQEVELASKLCNEENSRNSKMNKPPMIYKLVLTGGPCSGKTTGQARLSTFFENLGWKVYRVPETASILFGGGIRFSDLTKEDGDHFQENLLKTMLSIENTFFDLAKSSKKNCLLICDRGAMDAGAYMAKEDFMELLRKNNWDPVDLRDNRYNQVIHLITAAKGAEQFYQIDDNPCRTEGIELARQLDSLTIESWVGHPYIDVIDNTMNFDVKMRRMIECVCRRIGIDTKDRLATGATKHKFKIKCLPDASKFPKFQDFDVVHDYLLGPVERAQYRLRKRGQNGKWSYQHTTRRCEAFDQVVEVRRQITHRDYISYLTQRDVAHYTIYKTRRCFLWNDNYFQMDIYKSPFHPRCNGLILLETYSTKSGKELLDSVPPFLEVEKETTGDPAYSMYNLSLKAEWSSWNFEKKKVNCVRNIFTTENLDPTSKNENENKEEQVKMNGQANGTSR